MASKAVSKSISMPEDLWVLAREYAAGRHKTTSDWFQELVTRALQKVGLIDSELTESDLAVAVELKKEFGALAEVYAELREREELSCG